MHYIFPVIQSTTNLLIFFLVCVVNCSSLFVASRRQNLNNGFFISAWSRKICFYKLLTTCDKLNGAIELATRLFQQDWNNCKKKTILLQYWCFQLCDNLVTTGLYQSCKDNLVTCLVFLSSLLQDLLQFVRSLTIVSRYTVQYSYQSLSLLSLTSLRNLSGQMAEQVLLSHGRQAVK